MKSVSVISICFAVLILNVHFLEAQKSSYVSPGDVTGWVSHLASDEMRGRANGSPEMKTAASWIMERFREFGLKPALNDGSWFQDYNYKSRQGIIAERNVIGMIEGSDPSLKGEFIVLSAHFDHVGVRKGNLPDSIYNGADDNAAGTSTLIGIAKAISESSRKPGRSIIFAAFSGEENGMRGSRHFVSESPVPLKDIYVNLNFEMIGHSESYGKNNYYMTGTHLSNLDDIIADYNRNTSFVLIDTIEIARRLFFASDNVSFSRIPPYANPSTGIPSGTFATTTMAPHIHSPSDEARLFDFENMASLVNHFADIVMRLSASTHEIKWTDPSYVRPR